MAHRKYRLPVHRFFLSVACYVVKTESQKSNHKEKC